MHSPVELVSLTDLEAIPELLAAFCFSIARKETFKIQI
jgi:putative aminopeptidase FrvX